jgi:hypothetical protein
MLPTLDSYCCGPGYLRGFPALDSGLPGSGLTLAGDFEGWRLCGVGWGNGGVRSGGCSPGGSYVYAEGRETRPLCAPGRTGQVARWRGEGDCPGD